MTIDEAVIYIAGKAKLSGYSYQEFAVLVPEIKEMLYALPNTDLEEVDWLISEVL